MNVFKRKIQTCFSIMLTITLSSFSLVNGISNTKEPTYEVIKHKQYLSEEIALWSTFEGD